MVADDDALCFCIKVKLPNEDILPNAVAFFTPLLFNLTMLINYP